MKYAQPQNLSVVTPEHQAQGRHGERSHPGTQGLLGTSLGRGALLSDHPVTDGPDQAESGWKALTESNLTFSLPSRCNAVDRGRWRWSEDFDGRMRSVPYSMVAALAAALPRTAIDV